MGIRHNSGAYPSQAEDHAKLLQYKQQCLAASKRNPHENRVFSWLRQTGLKWSRQSIVGWRLADFWNGRLGVIVEVDGPDHSRHDDKIADAIHQKRSAIVVFRVRNQASDSELTLLLRQIASVKPWNERRAEIGLKAIKAAGPADVVYSKDDRQGTLYA